MRAWAVDTPGPIDSSPLTLIERPIPQPGRGQVRLRVLACGVCRTDLHLAEGDLASRRPLVVPGHEIVGVVDACGDATTHLHPGDRAGAAWLARTCETCSFCSDGRENLCRSPVFTGWDIDGGYATYVVVDELFTYPLPEGFDDASAAPLMCAGIIGFRALRLTGVRPGGRLGIYGFGGSAHLTAQIAIAEGIRVHVLTRSLASRELALSLGAESVGDTDDTAPELFDGAITFAPIGSIVPTALAALDRGGVLAVAGIHLTDIPALNYESHLFYERTLRSVTANTRQDGHDFLHAAAAAGITPTVHRYAFDQADQALRDLAHDRFSGAAVLVDFDA